MTTEQTEEEPEIYGELAIYNINGDDENSWSVVVDSNVRGVFGLVTMPDTFHNTLMSLVRILEERNAGH